MKLIRSFLLVITIVFATSCKHNDVTPTSSLDTVSISLAAESRIIFPPAALTSSTDLHARQLADWINSVNELSIYVYYLRPAPGAVKTNILFTATNARVTSVGDHVAWTWETDDGTNHYFYAYQITEGDDSYNFDVFVRTNSRDEWQKYVHSEEKKDKSSGSTFVLDLFHAKGSDTSVKIREYTWLSTGSVLQLQVNNRESDYRIDVTYDRSTKTGSISYYFQDNKWYDSEWDSAGNGSWVNYDKGVEKASGFWSI